MGSVWQALVLGFAGIRPGTDGVLAVDPRLPGGLVGLRGEGAVFRGRRVRLRKEHDGAIVWSDGPVRVRAGDREFEPTVGGNQPGAQRVGMGGRPMSTVLAVIDDSAAARPVLATAQAIAALWHGDVEALHVADDDGHTADAAADAADVTCASRRATSSPVVTNAAAHPDVAAIVIGARGRPEVPGPPVMSQSS